MMMGLRPHFHMGRHFGHRHMHMHMPPPPPPHMHRPYLPGCGCFGCGGCLMSILGIGVFAMMMLGYLLC